MLLKEIGYGLDMNKLWIGIFGFLAWIVLMISPGYGIYIEGEYRGQDTKGSKQTGLSSLDDKDSKRAELLYREGEVLVKFKKNASWADLKSSNLLSSMSIAKKFKFLSRKRRRLYLHFKSKKMTTNEMMAILQKNPRIEAVSPNYFRKLDQTIIPNDPLFGELWGLHNTGQKIGGSYGIAGADISAPEAWDVNTGSLDVVVALIDTGVDYVHDDLSANIWINPGEISENGIDDDGNGYIDDIYGYNFAIGSSDPMDNEGHGTHLAGIIAAVGDNGIGVAGVNWNAKIMALNVARPNFAYLADSDQIEAVEYAVLMKTNHGINIVAINASWGGFNYNPILKDAIEEAGNAGIIFCASAGNNGNSNDGIFTLYPSAYELPGIISVAAIDKSDSLTDFSNYGFGSVDLGAPGEDIKSTIPNGMGKEACIALDSITYQGTGVKHAGKTEGLSGLAYDCKMGKTPADFPSEVTNNIALIRRGGVTFMNKILNAQDAGALGAIVYNNSSGNFNGSLTIPGNWIPVVSISMEDGQDLLSLGIPNVTLVNRDVPDNAYALYTGTSMAAPHVTGAVALLAAEYPSDDLSRRINRIFSGVDRLAVLTGKVSTGGRLNIASSIDPDLVFNPFISNILSMVRLPNGIKAAITGIHFGELQGDVVCIDGTTERYADIISWSDTSISALMPAGASEYLLVRSQEGRDSNAKSVSLPVCPVKSITRDQSRLDLLRKFRDEVLLNSETGRKYVEHYYRNAPEVALLLLNKHGLKLQAMRLLKKVAPEINSILKKEKRSISPSLQEEIGGFLDEVSKYINPDLESIIEDLKFDIVSESFF